MSIRTAVWRLACVLSVAFAFTATPAVPLTAQSLMRAKARVSEVRTDSSFAWTVFTLQGERRSLESLRGRVIVVNSWATWCEPCVAELRTLQNLRDSIPDAELAFALIAPQRREPVAQFVRRRGLKLPVYLEAAPPPASFRFEAVPTTWILDRSGKIVLLHRGAKRWDTAAVIAQIRGLLAAPVDTTGAR
jgi:thiol-disulfide isomerase/thioredoxin